MLEIVEKVKDKKIKPEPYYIGISEAAIFLDICEETIRRYIAKAKAGKGSFPYYQDALYTPYKFVKAELILWRHNKTKGIVR